jgi:hypothetical protein
MGLSTHAADILPVQSIQPQNITGRHCSGPFRKRRHFLFSVLFMVPPERMLSRRLFDDPIHHVIIVQGQNGGTATSQLPITNREKWIWDCTATTYTDDIYWLTYSNC